MHKKNRQCGYDLNGIRTNKYFYIYYCDGISSYSCCWKNLGWVCGRERDVLNNENFKRNQGKKTRNFTNRNFIHLFWIILLFLPQYLNWRWFQDSITKKRCFMLLHRQKNVCQSIWQSLRYGRATCVHGEWMNLWKRIVQNIGITFIERETWQREEKYGRVLFDIEKSEKNERKNVAKNTDDLVFIVLW